jgi:hypothetical protein
MVHFAIALNGEIRPLCGDWAGKTSWTMIRPAVTCPKCLALLERTQRVAVSEAA